MLAHLLLSLLPSTALRSHGLPCHRGWIGERIRISAEGLGSRVSGSRVQSLKVEGLRAESLRLEGF